MNCPRCAKGMGEILSQGVLIDFCTACKGAWLDQGEARFFAADPNKVEAALAGELRNPHPSKIKCPRCTGAMTEGGVFTDDYLLDRCNECQGVWFDGRELSRLRDAKLVGLDPVASRSSRPRGAMAGAMGGANAPTTSSAAYIGGGPADALSASIDAASQADGGAPTFNAAALAAAIPAIPNLALRSTAVFGGLTFIMGGIFIAATLAGGLHPAFAVFFTLLMIGIQYAVGPFILDFSLRWMNGLRWMTRAEIPPHIAKFLDASCKQHGVKFPHIGIIEDGAPNAFTYGHTPNNARIVITRGILNLLNEEEADAVVAHELGHVVHWDAVVMTLAGCVPILCYGIYRACIRMARGSRKNGQYAWAVALVAYVLYIVAEYLVLMLSRTREYYADRFSAEATGNPNALASALVKVAYGLVSNESAIAQGQQQARPAAMAAGGGMRAFGIFDPTAARNLAAASYAGGSFSRENLVGAMQWDLWNPWAKWFELHSTHPLPARRLQALAGEALKRGQLPLIVFDKTQPESYWDEFAVDVFIKLLPAGLALILAAAALVILGPGALLGGAVMGYGVGKLASTMFMYHTDSEQEGYPMASTAALLKVVKVSPVRGVPARLKGKVIGRGNPGHILSEDVVIQDKTGILFLDYRTIFSPMSWWFALSKVPQIMGQEVEARGWYRRGPAPYFELREIRWAGGSKTSWIYPAKLVWGGLCTIGGAFLTFAGFLAVL